MASLSAATIGRPRRARAALLALALACPGCAGFVQYTDELRDERTGRTLFVRTPATVGGIVGFAIGLPVSVVALPVTYTVYAYQKEATPMRADPVSTLLFPSFVLWRAGALIGAPSDAVEWAVWRVWQGTPTLTEEEQEQVERRHDEEVLQSYPVEPVYPTDANRRRAARERGPT